MIAVTRLDGSPMVVNVDQIAWIEGRPDTVISMMNGEKLIVRESPDELVERAREFKRDIASPTVGVVRGEVVSFARHEAFRAGDLS